jgi:HEPN domain-containing protein
MSEPGQWERCAQERARDMTALWEAGRHHGAIYMAGYVVECRLKELLQRSGRSFPTTGRAGHNLQTLWEAAGFKVLDLHENRRFFMEFWNTDLRYQSTSSTTDYEALRAGAIGLSGYLEKQIKRKVRR